MILGLGIHGGGNGAVIVCPEVQTAGERRDLGRTLLSGNVVGKR